jgi:hypothetical protein
VIHTAFFHGFGQASFGIRLRVMLGGSPIVTHFMAAAVKVDRRAIETLGNSLRDGGHLYWPSGQWLWGRGVWRSKPIRRTRTRWVVRGAEPKRWLWRWRHAAL